MPPNFGADYVARFEAIFPELAQRNNPGSVLLPFILEGVGGDPRLNQRDQISSHGGGPQDRRRAGLARAGTLGALSDRLNRAARLPARRGEARSG